MVEIKCSVNITEEVKKEASRLLSEGLTIKEILKHFKLNVLF